MLERLFAKMGYAKVEKAVGPLMDDNRIFKTLREILGASGSSVVTQPYKQSVWVYACINAISENLSRVPFLLRKDAGDLEPGIIDSGPLYDLFQNPNPLMNCQDDLIKATMIFYCLRGECFWIMEGREDITKIPKEIWVFDPIRFESVQDKRTGMLIGWKYKGVTETYFSVNEVIHFKMFNPYDDIRGLSPIEAAKLSVDQSYQASLYNKAFFENGATVGGFIGFPDELTDESYNRLVKQFEERHKGVGKAHKIAVVEGGGTFTPAKLTQKDMEFIEGKNLTKEEILAAYKVNEVVLGNYRNIKCFHPDTEVLTIDGFKSVTEIKKGDLVSTLNPKTGKAEFKPVTKVYAYDYDDIMYKQSGKGSKLAYCITPEHKMLTRRVTEKGDYEFIPIKDINNLSKGYSVPRSAKWNCGELPTIYDIGKRKFDRKDYRNGSKQGLKETEFPIKQWLKFLGWFISEGNYFESGGRFEIGISQTKPEGRKQFKNDMKGFPYVITEYDRVFKLSGKDLYTYLMDNVGHYCDEKKIPADIKKLHPSLLRYLFDALMVGDGHRFSKDRVRFSTTSFKLAEDVFEIAIKLGYTPTMSGGRPGYYKDKEGERKYCKPVWHVEMSKQTALKDGRICNVEKIHYKGKVHCFEVAPYHTTLIRYDGKIMWIGQSYEGIKSAHKAFWEECLMPKVLYFENVLWSRFFSKIGQRRGKGRIWGQFDLANVGPLQVNYKEKIQTAKEMFFMGWPINHINKRLELGMKEVPWGNEWWVPGGYASVNTLRGTPPKKEPDDDKENDDDDSTKFYCAPIETELKNKFTKFLFEVRKRAITASVEKKGWDCIIKDRDILKLRQSLDAIYSAGITVGVSTVQLDVVSIERDFSEDIASYKNARSVFIADSFGKMVGTIVERLSVSSIGDEKIREVFNLLSAKSATIAKSETEAAFRYGKEIALRTLRANLLPSLGLMDERRLESHD